MIAFDKYSNPASGELAPIPAELRGKLPQMKARLKGFSDLQSNIDSPEATDVKRTLSALKPDEYKSTIEELSLAGQYIHGTHVAGIAVDGQSVRADADVRASSSATRCCPIPVRRRELAEKDARNCAGRRRFHEEATACASST